MKNSKQLRVWQEAHQLTLDVYKELRGFPKHEQFGFVNQMQRSSSSIPTNIAEGCGRIGDAEFKQFLHIALGSANELEYRLFLSKDLDYLTTEKYEPCNQRINQIKRMLITLIQKLDTYTFSFSFPPPASRFPLFTPPSRPEVP